MKELSIEEKAKRYVEAIKKAKEKYAMFKGMKQGDILEEIFPELEELGDEEEVRKAMIDFFKHEREEGVTVLHYGVNIERMIAWLEKQGEQKVSVAEFKAKDWYVSKVDGKIYNAKFMEKTPTNQARRLEIEKAAMSATGIIEQEEWFIKGAEWSDKNPSYISSEKQGEQKSANKVEPKFKVGDWVVCEAALKFTAFKTGDVVQISNKETLKLFLMFENCFRLWDITKDAKDGDVLVYGDNSNDHHVEVIMIFKSLRTEKSAFTHFHIFDNKFRIDDWCDCGKNVHPATKEQRDQLEKAMADIGYEWNAEKKELKKIENEIEIPFGAKDSELQEATYYIPKGFHAEIDDDKVVIKKGKQKPTDEEMKEVLHTEYEKGRADAIAEMHKEWSEEDEGICIEAIKLLTNKSLYEICINLRTEIVDWLKSLKKRYTWKPSDEQMEFLQKYAEQNNYDGSILTSLYQDLRKRKK